MTKRWIVLSLTLGLGISAAQACNCGGQSGGASSAAPTKASSNKRTPIDDFVLQPGRYSARIASLPCGGCGPLIESTLGQNAGVESAQVNMETKMLTFSVKDSASIKFSALQKQLDVAAAKMGMGADYGLSEFQTVTNGQQSLSSFLESQQAREDGCGHVAQDGCSDH